MYICTKQTLKILAMYNAYSHVCTYVCMLVFPIAFYFRPLCRQFIFSAIIFSANLGSSSFCQVYRS
jgi:hypothetical protein